MKKQLITILVLIGLCFSCKNDAKETKVEQAIESEKSIGENDEVDDPETDMGDLMNTMGGLMTGGANEDSDGQGMFTSNGELNIEYLKSEEGRSLRKTFAEIAEVTEEEVSLFLTLMPDNNITDLEYAQALEKNLRNPEIETYIQSGRASDNFLQLLAESRAKAKKRIADYIQGNVDSQKDSILAANTLEALMKQELASKEYKSKEKTARKIRESGNMDDLLVAFDNLNAESGVVANVNKLKKADSIMGKNSFGSFELDKETADMMSQKMSSKEAKIANGKMTNEERQTIRGFSNTKKHLHNTEEIEEFVKMMEDTDLDKMKEEGKITPAFAEKQKRDFVSSKISIRDKQKKAIKAKREFKLLNPDLFFGDEVGMTYFGTLATAVYLPLGKLSFADQVVHYYHPENLKTAFYTTGEPDGYSERNQLANVHSLGTKGTLTIKFEDNALVDVNGPDLYVFEMGKVEPTNLEISKDGKEWIGVGKIDGGVAMVDIHDFIEPNELYYYVRLTDLDTGSGIPGADVDAIAAIGAAMRLNLDSKVLFETGKADLKAEGIVALKKLAESISVLEKGNVIVEGHTDDVGSSASNKQLSLARAKSVSSELKKLLPSQNYKWREKGLGEEKPLVENDSDANRAKNRRVEVLVVPN